MKLFRNLKVFSDFHGISENAIPSFSVNSLITCIIRVPFFLFSKDILTDGTYLRLDSLPRTRHITSASQNDIDIGFAFFLTQASHYLENVPKFYSQ